MVTVGLVMAEWELPLVGSSVQREDLASTSGLPPASQGGGKAEMLPSERVTVRPSAALSQDTAEVLGAPGAWPSRAAVCRHAEFRAGPGRESSSLVVTV